MLTIRKSARRGHAKHGWLNSYHTFSFADYYDPKNMGFGVLRVINEDRIQGGTGFGTHSHRDMEIISYVIEGGIEHKDSMGNKTVIRPGEVQRMSAGTGVAHSEYNAMPDQTTHFLQIWILPKKNGIAPSYGQKSFLKDFEKSNFLLVASEDGRDGSIEINQNANIYVGKPKASERIEFAPANERKIWIQMIQGEIIVNGETAVAGDGVALTEEKIAEIQARETSEFILFDLPI